MKSFLYLLIIFNLFLSSCNYSQEDSDSDDFDNLLAGNETTLDEGVVGVETTGKVHRQTFPFEYVPFNKSRYGNHFILSIEYSYESIVKISEIQLLDSNNNLISFTSSHQELADGNSSTFSSGEIIPNQTKWDIHFYTSGQVMLKTLMIKTLNSQNTPYRFSVYNMNNGVKDLVYKANHLYTRGYFEYWKGPNVFNEFLLEYKTCPQGKELDNVGYCIWPYTVCTDMWNTFEENPNLKFCEIRVDGRVRMCNPAVSTTACLNSYQLSDPCSTYNQLLSANGQLMQVYFDEDHPIFSKVCTQYIDTTR